MWHREVGGFMVSSSSCEFLCSYGWWWWVAYIERRMNYVHRSSIQFSATAAVHHPPSVSLSHLAALSASTIKQKTTTRCLGWLMFRRFSRINNTNTKCKLIILSPFPLVTGKFFGCYYGLFKSGLVGDGGGGGGLRVSQVT